MKLYDFTQAPNPRRVRMFLAEKGIKVPTEQVNVREMVQFAAAFQAVNPYAMVPVLELDDGTYIGESVAICRYVEEIHPEPPLMGIDARDKAIIEMWNRRAEHDGLMAVAETVRNLLPLFEDRALPGTRGVPQIPALVERGRASATRFFEHIDVRLGDSEFLAGPRFTIADITAWVATTMAARGEISVPKDRINVKRWFDVIAARPSAQA
jgi:glutathione S-transferase